MIELCKLIWCGLVGLFRSRASLEIEVLALRHQLNILRRKSPKRPILGSIDRLMFGGIWLGARCVERIGNYQTGNRDSLAPRRFPLVLAVEIAAAWWPSKGACGR